MKVLWIVNSVLNRLSEFLYQKPANGVWMDALLADFKGNDEYRIVVATTLRTKETIKVADGNISYYGLPDCPPILYNEEKKSNIAAWRSLLETERPDLIQVWGTEFTHGLCALREAGRIPSVIYMQGVISSIARYYQAGISYRDLQKTVTFRDIVKRDSILQQQKKYELRAAKEAEMLRLAGRIISENDWCDCNIRSVVPDIKAYRCPLSINEVFSQYKWNAEDMEKHSIVCTASGYTIKGLHILLHAVALVKKKCPDVKLYVPGTKLIAAYTLQGQLRKNGYSKYIERLVGRLDLADNIIWMGNVSQEELAKRYQRSNVFVMCSAIENHSSSLKEAMMVGVPCISSAVGGIPEYVKDGENGLLYRFEEFPVLAELILNLFNSFKRSQCLSGAGRKSALELHHTLDIFCTVTDVYRKIVCE